MVCDAYNAYKTEQERKFMNDKTSGWLESYRFQSALGVFNVALFLVVVGFNLFWPIPSTSNWEWISRLVMAGVLLYFAVGMLFQKRSRFTSRDHLMANLVGTLLFLAAAWLVFRVVFVL